MRSSSSPRSFQASARTYAYADDWIYALPLKFTSLHNWITWAFAQHVDHRIPIQKLSNFFILRAAGFDFRYLVAVNYLMGVATSAMLLYVAKSYRGYLRVGDLIIPFALLHYGVGYSLWGFQFQFLSSVFFMTLFIYFSFHYTQKAKNGFLSGAALALLAASLCGMNGVLFAITESIGMLVWLFYPRTTPRNVPAIAMFAVVLAIGALIWVKWVPSAASSVGGINSRVFIRYIYSLVPASMGVLSFQNTFFAFLTVSLLLTGMLAFMAQKLKSRSLTLDDYVLAIAALASLMVMISVAVGRSKAQGEWNNVLGMHYGLMSVFIPVCSWLIVSKWLPDRASSLVGIALAAMFYIAFIENAQWRYSVVNSAGEHQTQIVQALQAGTDAKVLADTYVNDFTIDTPQNRSDVANGITAFRADGATLYGGSR
ncbi:hypothetical protein [Paraburkholderia fungorum]|nr:hypothetical protein [Paraburkholderia fungorum]